MPKKLLCGLDEAGRGAWVGPVMAACVHIPENVRHFSFWTQVNDSKKLTAKKRELLFSLIQQYSYFGIASSSIQEIDELNILWASMRAMECAFEYMCSDFAISPSNMHALIDGNKTPKNLSCPSDPIIGGDGLHLEIAAASILAKVSRDHLMQSLHQEYPQYGWKTNMGYGAKAHIQALHKYGPTLHHRKSFAPIRALLAA